MTTPQANSSCATMACLLLPVFLLACLFTLYIGIQTAFLVVDHETLQQAHEQQDKALAQIDKIKAQFGALSSGTAALAKQDNKDAQEIILKLQKAGVDVAPQQQKATAPAPTPAETK